MNDYIEKEYKVTARFLDRNFTIKYIAFLLLNLVVKNIEKGEYDEYPRCNKWFWKNWTLSI